MQDANGLGRVVVVDMGEGGRRVLRAIRELARLGRADAAVALHAPQDRQAAFLREADETVELATQDAGARREALAQARPATVWLGRTAPAQRAELAAWCAEHGVRLVGPSAETLKKTSTPAGLTALARELGVPLAGPAPVPAARLLEAVVARDAEGRTRVIGVGVPALEIRGRVALAESGAAEQWSERERAAAALAVKASQVAGWVGVLAVQLQLDEAGREQLVSLEPTARTGPAIEAVSGVDLVRLALAVAAGEPVGGAAAPGAGFAVAARILPRDPEADLRGAGGRVERLRLPTDPVLRVEAELDEGDVCAPGETVATVVAVADSRREALARLAQGLEDADVLVGGRGTTKAWIAALCAHAEAQAGAAADGAIGRLAARGERLVGSRPEVALVAAALETYDLQLALERQTFLAEARRGRPRVGPSSGRVAELRYEGQRFRIEVRQTGPATYRVIPAGGKPVDVRVERLAGRERRLVIGDLRARVLSSVEGLRHLVEIDGVPHAIQREPAGLVVSPMPAVVVAIAVQVGQRVAAGEPVARIESMKVEVVVPAPTAGVVREVVTLANAQVDAGAPLIRLDPDDGEPAAEPGTPLDLHAPSPPAPATPRERYLAALEELHRILLGFDVSPADAKKLASSWAELTAAVVSDDPQVLAAEEAAFSAFVDVQSLYSRTPRREGGTAAKPPLEELWRYLHEPEHRGEGLSPEFVEGLRRALSHYGVALESPGAELETALLRIQKAHERSGEPMVPILGILERRLASETPALDERGPETRRLLDRLTELGRELHRPLADLAGELRYQRFDQPLFEAARAAAYVQAEKDLAALGTVKNAERDAVINRLVACAQPLATLLIERMAGAAQQLRPRLVETLLRRYYRIAPVGPVTSRVEAGVSCAVAEYASEGRRVRLHACFALVDEVEAAAKVLARISAEAPPEVELALELYLWSPVSAGSHDERAERMKKALAGAGFGRPVRRAAVAVAVPGKGLGRNSSQEHFTFRGGPGDFAEDPRYRGVHPMLFRRMQLGRLSKFELERLPSVEDVFLYLGTARENPKDERLFAVAEVRDLTPVRDPAGRVVQLPHLERMLHEALAGMRRFQAHRAPDKRLEWNRVLLTVEPPLLLSREEIRSLAERLAPETEGLGLEVVLIDVRVPDPFTGALRSTLLRVHTTGSGVSIRYDVPTDRPLEPMGEYQQRVIQLRRRGLTHPFELVRMLAPTADSEAGVPPGEFQEHELDAAGVLAPVDRPPGKNSANVVVGLVKSFTRRYPEGMTRVALLSDPSRAMGSLAEPECARIIGALDLAEKLKIPLEWFAVSAGAKISMESGTENMDWISKVLRRIIEFTQGGGEINIVVCGINVGGQPYWNAEATMLMHTRGILVMVAGSAMVLTGKDALDYSGSVSAEDNQGIGGYDRIMGPNGQAQYRAANISEGLQILLRHYDHTYVAPGERFPRRATTSDPADRDVRTFPHGPQGGAGFEVVGDIFSAEKNPDRKKPFDIRRVMAAVIDQDHPSLERWRDMRGGDTSVVWDAHLGGWPVCLLGIEARPIPRLEFVPADGPELWSSGTLFPSSSKKLARAINGASGIRPVLVLANLSGFDGSPESMRRIQLEYGAEIGRAVVNFRGPFVFCVVSRYHGGAFVVFSKALREEIEVIAVEGARASVIGGAPAAATVFAREVETRTRKDPRVVAAEEAARASGSRLRLAEVVSAVRSEKVGQVAEEFDSVHTVERALKVGSLDRIISARDLRPYLIGALERGIARHQG
jgi:acetyl/propionyl-CoA carboxylase alpha subunit/acetyl-CoA carboxylase carboxyltransferase component